jgi:hypothetical protein
MAEVVCSRALEKALRMFGGESPLARYLGVTEEALSGWLHGAPVPSALQVRVVHLDQLMEALERMEVQVASAGLGGNLGQIRELASVVLRSTQHSSAVDAANRIMELARNLQLHPELRGTHEPLLIRNIARLRACLRA